MAEKPGGQSARATSSTPEIVFSDPIVITEQVSVNGGSLYALIPKEIGELLRLDSRSVVELKVRRVDTFRIKPSQFEGM